jgi:hypothetical protein
MSILIVLFCFNEVEIGAMSFLEVCSLSKATIGIDSAGKDFAGVGHKDSLFVEGVDQKMGVGLRNRAGENNCFLNVTVQVDLDSMCIFKFVVQQHFLHMTLFLCSFCSMLNCSVKDCWKLMILAVIPYHVN